MFSWFKNSNGIFQANFVFTIGGYYSAFQVPAHYPRAPRLAISWALGDPPAIRGEAHFAITSSIAGLHINFVLSPGLLRAWFDAYADLLLNYAPFNVVVTGGLTIGVLYNTDTQFIHIHVSVEVSATPYPYGALIAGIVYVDFWVFGFDIEFGDCSPLADGSGLLLERFYGLALAAHFKTQAQSSTKSTDTTCLHLL